MQNNAARRREGGRRLRSEQHTTKPSISIITVVFNGGNPLAATLESILAQSFRDYELIIIDGGSTDGTVERIAALEKWIDYWSSEPDSGIYDAMNKGIRLARGEWIYFLNSGDTFVDSSVLEQIAKVLKESYSELVVGYVRVVSAGTVTGKFPLDLTPAKSARKLFQSRFCHQAIFVRRRSYLGVSCFSLDFPTFADFMTCYQIISRTGEYGRCDIEIANFDLCGVSSDYRKSAQLYRERERIFESYGEYRSRLLYFLGLLKAYAYRYKRALLEALS